MSHAPPPSPPASLGTALDENGGRGQSSSGQTIQVFATSLVGAIVIFSIQVALFLLIKNKFSRIYRPRTYLVPEKERTSAPPNGIWDWITPVFKTSNAEFIQKCGLDAYFFLRFLRTLLKIFIPLACVILPILLPINAVGGKGSHFAVGKFNDSATWGNSTGLDELAWGNVRPQKTDRYWAHLILAVGVVTYTCWVFFDELRGYVRLRQAYLTSPQHRLRASATTVLVSAIPKKWCTYEALDGLYDVFPGGIRNIWVNRNFDELNEKVKKRTKLALALEAAETSLIKKAKQAQLKKSKKDAKKHGSKQSKEGKEQEKKKMDDQADGMADTAGISSGNPHQVRHTIDDAINDGSGEPSREQSQERGRSKPMIPIPVVGPGLEAMGQGLEAVGHGLGNVGKTVFGGFKTVGKDVDDRLNTTGGFVVDSAADDEGPPVPLKDKELDSGVESSCQVQTPELTNSSFDGAREHGNSPSSRTHINQTEISSTRNTSNSHTNGAAIADRVNGNLDFGEHSSDHKHRNANTKGGGSKFMFWKESRNGPFDIPSPTPHGQEDGDYPFDSPRGARPSTDKEDKKFKIPLPFVGSKEKEAVEYPHAYDEEATSQDDDAAVWKKYLKDSDRETMRLPVFGLDWMPSLPLLGQKVDTIYYCRKEVARLNIEIEKDQKEPERFPLMNSAFIQFNHQVAAHMACQSVSHHIPSQMAPRMVEISPGDVIWNNMSIRWWERYIRTGIVLVVIVGLIIGWAIPVTFTGLLSQLDYLSGAFTWLAWLEKIPKVIRDIIQGILPPALLGLLLFLLPLILRFLAKQEGSPTGMGVELSVQDSYFFFLFVQLFLVVSISTGISSVLKQIVEGPQSVPSILASNLPKAANYFFSYLLLQALSTSAGALVQVMGLVGWFVLAPLLDNTARQKWKRQVTLPNMQWGTFFPVYTNLAAIGLIYSVVAPLILIFNIITFSLFWIVYRYNTLYVTKFRFDTGGLLYPKAINQLFTGLYVMELCLIGLFFLVRGTDDDGKAIGSPCTPQAIIMILVFAATAIYQWLLNKSFAPLFRYLPITLEDDAVIRDEEFARVQEKKWLLEEEQAGDGTNEIPEAKQRRSMQKDQRAESIELQNVGTRKKSLGMLDPRNLGNYVTSPINKNVFKKGSWADRSRDRSRTRRAKNWAQSDPNRHHDGVRRRPTPRDVEAQKAAADPSLPIGEALFSGLNDEIEDLTPDERDKLVQRAFLHEALRARRPVIWIPRDDLGVSDDEILRTQQFTNHIWISNEHTGLDGKGNVVYKKSPPDFSEVDLIDL